MRPAFERAALERIGWLAENAPEDWLVSFLAALDDLRRDLERFPELGAMVRQDQRVILRRKRLTRELPYVVYYAHLPGRQVRELFLTHLFHERQRRPRLDRSAWPW